MYKIYISVLPLVGFTNYNDNNNNKRIVRLITSVL